MEDEIEFEERDLDHSKRLDVHVWSHHSDVNALVDEIWEQHFNSAKKEIEKRHIKVVLLDLYVNWVDDPTLATSFARGNSAYKAGSIYNELHISKKTIDVVDRLEAAGLVETKGGFLDRRSGVGREARMWPTDKLIRKFKEAKFSPYDVSYLAGRRTVILRSGNDEDHPGSNIEYEDTSETLDMEGFNSAYNEVLRSVFIDIPDLGDGPEDYVVSQREKFTYRVFNRRSFEHGGRFVGGWWVSCPRELRKRIFINDWPTTEIDFSGLHIVLLYALEGIEYWRQIDRDPYLIEKPKFIQNDRDCRDAVKRLMLVTLNAADQESAFRAFRSEADTGHYFKRFKDAQLAEILAQISKVHEPIQSYFNSDWGTRLMRYDSTIAWETMREFVDEEIPILCVHDSFIVPTGYEKKLIEEMAYGFEIVMGVPLDAERQAQADEHWRLAAMKLKQPPVSDLFDDLMDWQPYEPFSREQLERQEAYLDRQSPNRTKRYERRFAAFKDWIGAEEYNGDNWERMRGRVIYPE